MPETNSMIGSKHPDLPFEAIPLNDNHIVGYKGEKLADNLLSDKEPTISEDYEKLTPKLQDGFKKAKTFEDFVNNHGADFNDWHEGNNPELSVEVRAKEVWNDIKYKETGDKLASVDKEKAISTIREKIPENIRRGWFVNADSDYKPLIEKEILNNQELRNSAMSLAHINYQNAVGEKIPYEKFVNLNVEVYRGGNFDYIENDNFVAYSFSKSIAKEFAKGGEIETRTISIKDTLGSLQSDNEAELMVRRRK